MFNPGGKKVILSVDGGGMRGMISIAMLAELEQMTGKTCQQMFDMVGGTSTGAIIAAGLARGMSVADIASFYQQFGKEAFAKRSFFERWKSLYDDGALVQKLQQVFASNGKAETLEPQFLKTLLLVVTKNLTTDSAWPVSSNPNATYNTPTRPDCNLRIPLWKLVRASTAAPVYFPPEVVSWDPANPGKSFVFVDGGTTPYNFPGFLMVRMATAEAYKLNWPMGEDKLLLVSVGTGWSAVPGTTVDDPETNLAAAGLTTLKALMRQAEVDQDLNCRTVGRCSYGHVLDREVGDLIPRRNGARIPLSEKLGRAFLYCRYDAELTASGLAALGVQGIDPASLGGMDDVSAMEPLTAVGKKLAEHVDLADWGDFVGVPPVVVP